MADIHGETQPRAASTAGDGPALVQIGRGERGVVTLGERAAIIAPLTSGADLEALPAILEGQPVDMLEWRVDLYEPFAQAPTPQARREELRQGLVLVAGKSTVPVLATIRTTDEGGRVSLRGIEYAALLGELARYADAVDVQIAVPTHGSHLAELIDQVHEHGAKVVASHHNFESTPSSEELAAVFSQMAQYGADVLKIACRAHNATDTQSIIEAARQARDTYQRPTIAIGMGEYGTITRTGGMSIGNAATFGVLTTSSAPGQLHVAQLKAALEAHETQAKTPENTSTDRKLQR